MTISVLVPTHQRPALLQEAVDSVLAQEPCGHGIELVVVHDGLDAPKGPRADGPVEFIYASITKAGLSAVVNRAFALSHGDYVTVLADDDLMAPCKLRVLAKMLDTKPDVGVAYGIAEHMRHGIPTGVPRSTRQWRDAHLRFDWQTVVRGEGCGIHGTATLYRRSLWEQAGPWDTSLWTAEEWEYHLRLLSVGATFEAVPDVTDFYRIHSTNKSIADTRARHTARKAVHKAIGAKYMAMARSA